jgi:hypothetical protein
MLFNDKLTMRKRERERERAEKEKRSKGGVYYGAVI